MAYLNYGACYIAEVPSSSSCPTGTAQGVSNWGLISKGGGLTGMTINNSGLCSNATFTSGKTFMTMNPIPETVRFKITAQSNKFGNTTYTSILEGSIAGFDDTLRDMFAVAQKTNSHLWVTLLAGQTFIIGVDNVTTPTASLGARLTKQEWDSGLESGTDEISGLNFEFTAKSSTRPPRVLDSLLTSAFTN